MSHSIQWLPEYSVGIKSIDEQHKKFLALISISINAINEQSEFSQISKVLDDLITYADYHFSTEEKYFKECNYENATEHMEKHQKFYQEIDALRKRYANDKVNVSFELIDYLEDWLIDHINDTDQEYVKCFLKNNIK